MSDIKAIETVYKGYRFRSRLEARWAVFFDALGVQWEYEKQGFEIDMGDWYENEPQGMTLKGAQKYLPDFWLPQVHMWAEVKPVWATSNELALCGRLAEDTGHSCLILDGVPDERPYLAVGELEFNHGGWDLSGVWYHLCDGNLYHLSERRFFCIWEDYITDWPDPQCRPTASEWCCDRQSDGVIAARSARFEHGESGARR